MATKQEMLAKAESLLKKVKTGKIKGEKKIYAARRYASSLKSMAKHAGKKKVKKSSVKSKAPKHRIAEGQGFLPTFLKQMNLVRIEEMVADRIFKSIEQELKGVGDTKKAI